MKEKRYSLAIDIGASSGRHILGWIEDGKIKTEEVYRFFTSKGSSSHGDDGRRIFISLCGYPVDA